MASAQCALTIRRPPFIVSALRDSAVPGSPGVDDAESCEEAKAPRCERRRPSRRDPASVGESTSPCTQLRYNGRVAYTTSVRRQAMHARQQREARALAAPATSPSVAGTTHLRRPTEPGPLSGEHFYALSFNPIDRSPQRALAGVMRNMAPSEQLGGAAHGAPQTPPRRPPARPRAHLCHSQRSCAGVRTLYILFHPRNRRLRVYVRVSCREKCSTGQI